MFTSGIKDFVFSNNILNNIYYGLSADVSSSNGFIYNNVIDCNTNKLTNTIVPFLNLKTREVKILDFS
jgi:hypothetical protein